MSCSQGPPPITDEIGQATLVDAMASGEVTGGRRPLKRVTTHLSHVFIDEARAYKLSRAKRHPFVDLSQPAQREAAARGELKSNQGLAPELYERVAAITSSKAGHYSVDGEGQVIDWALVMRRIPDGATLDSMAAAGLVTVDLVASLAEKIADFHSRLEPSREGGPDFGLVIDELQRTAGPAGQELRQAALFRRLRTTLEVVSPLIEQRRRQGCVRTGHGDLHLQNICLFEGRVTPFDAIGFDVQLATSDVLYDLAFLLMDLRARGLRRQANVVMNRYWDRTGETEEALGLLPFFMAMRAAVRMAVLSEGGRPREAEVYLRLGVGLLRSTRPRLVAVGGLSGVGKSEVARAIAFRLPGVCGARVLRTDLMRKALAGSPGQVRLGPAAYSARARAQVYGAMSIAAAKVLAAGVSVIADATFQSEAARRAIAAVGHVRAFRGLWLEAPWALRRARIEGRIGDPSDITLAAASHQRPPHDLGTGWRTVDASGPLGAVVRNAVSQLGDQATI